MQQLDTPILFLIFNRSDTTSRVFETIKRQKPRKFYIASDGPRKHKPGEEVSVDAVRKHVMEGIDWPCTVHTLFRDNNLGCGQAVSEAITWFFEQEPFGIILEDDCLPLDDFFPFCDEMLRRYADDENVFHINGSSFLFMPDVVPSSSSYTWSKYPSVWGWASWARAWKNYDFSMIDFKPVSGTNRETRYWNEVFSAMRKGEIDTWDHQWTYCIWKHKAKVIIPAKSLIHNIGFNADGTHTKEVPGWWSNIQHGSVLPIIHPSHTEPVEAADQFIFSNIYDPKISVLRRIAQRIKRMLR